MSKKMWVSLGLILVILVLLGTGYAFYRKHLSGSSPVFLPPPPASPESWQGNGSSGSINSTGLPLQIADGFSISTYAKALGDPRALRFDPAGRLVVSIPGKGKLVAFDDNNGTASSPIPVIENLSKPHGFVFNCSDSSNCKIYIAEVNAVKVFDYNTTTAKASNGKKILDLPAGGNHTSRTLHLLDTPGSKKLLVATGSSCNVCRESDERRAAIWSANLDGSDFKPYATGLRNSVFIVENPSSKQLWATEMGRDLLGDNTPPDEVNIIEDGKNYGWPICYGKGVHDTDFDRNQYIRDPCQDKVPAYIDIPAHSAPLGLAFVPTNDAHYNEAWPEDLQGDLLVAFHGSWNRSVPTGYKIVRYDLDEQGKVLGVSDFLSGFLATDGKTAFGRPVDILASVGRPIFVSDDKAGNIFKIAPLSNQSK